MASSPKKIDDDEEEEELYDNSIQIDQVKKEYTLKNKYYPLIEKNLPINERQLLKHIAKYRDKNMGILSSPYPLAYPIWTAEDEAILYKVTGINKDELLDDIQIVKNRLPDEVKDKKPNFTPEATIFLLIMKYYIENLEPEKLKLICYYNAYSIYWSIFYKYFSINHHTKYVAPREETMIYTINNLSNKFILKKVGSVDGLLYYCINNALETYRKRIKRLSDAEIYYIIDQFKTRVNNNVNKIRNEYGKNDREKNVIFKSDTFKNDNTLYENTSMAGEAESLANEFTNKFFSSAPNQKIISQACQLPPGPVSKSELRTTLNVLLDNQRISQVKEFYSAIFYIYLSEPGITRDSIKSIKFLGTMEKLYRRSNTNDKNIATIKKLMNDWLEEGSKTYRVSNREATLNSFRKAIFYYFILLVTSSS